MKITIASGSLQPFTTDQWSMHQKDTIRKVAALLLCCANLTFPGSS